MKELKNIKVVIRKALKQKLCFEMNRFLELDCIYCLNELQIVTTNPYKPGANYKCHDCKKTIKNESLHCFCK